ncbi:MAG: polysaccharide deacetylase family protein [Clostridium sp.]|jgi:peptidoglycan/xylan/chitin deacetylase (PgdA/CDA1 family)|nr:polysaccharide deacetylase family protein [Clostridium sp.]
MRFVYPQGKRKALTFSYDDGQSFDKKLVEVFNRYGIKGTFHLNSGNLGRRRKGDDYVAAQEVAALYQGHEVACHGVEHRSLPTLTSQQAAMEIGADRKALEELTGCLVQGLSYAFGNYSQEVKRIARSLGIRYCRTTKATGNFFPPADFLEWHPTCHHSDGLAERGTAFLDVPAYYELPLMYVWGHSYEFGRAGDFSTIEAFAEKMAHQENIWYASNLQICRYIQAVRSQEFSADGTRMYNPTAVRVWVLAGERLLEAAPGEIVALRE